MAVLDFKAMSASEDKLQKLSYKKKKVYINTTKIKTKQNIAVKIIDLLHLYRIKILKPGQSNKICLMERRSWKTYIELGRQKGKIYNVVIGLIYGL